ncbi:MAG TPA: hypothetical protein DD827_03885, partial [Gammaproteobacteria bacterium]|nr:hypothetical protein [Gammaproteobacteria bacterium]
MRFGRDAIPAGDRLTILIGDGFYAVISQHGVPIFNVVKITQYGFGWVDVAVGAEVPLQVADPQHHFGDGGGAGVEFDAEKLMRIDGEAAGF